MPSFDWIAPDGKALPAEKWLPAEEPRAIVIGIHGLGGAADYFGSLGTFLAQSGVATYAVNLRGQGRDPDPSHRGAYLDLQTIASDITAFCQSVKTSRESLPLFFCGESMGSLLLAWMISQNLLPAAQGVIFSVPVVSLRQPSPPIVKHLVHILGLLAPTVRFSTSWFVTGNAKPLVVTRDEVYEKHARTGPHRIPVFTFRTLSVMGKLIESSPALAEKIHLPSLVLAAGHDIYLNSEQVQAWFEKLAARDKTLHVYPDAFHLLWNDNDREQVLSDILSWLDARMPMTAKV